MILDMPKETFIWLCFLFGMFFAGRAFGKGTSQADIDILKHENELIKIENKNIIKENKFLRKRLTDKPLVVTDKRHLNEPY